MGSHFAWTVSAVIRESYVFMREICGLINFLYNVPVPPYGLPVRTLTEVSKAMAKAYNTCRPPEAATATSEALVVSQAKLA